MHLFDAATLQALVAQFGYAAIFVVIALESAGLPLPGEATLVSAAIYASTTQALSVPGVIAAAAAGAVVGDNLGFWIGRRFGIGLLLTYGGRIGLNASRLKIGRYLFDRYGAFIVVIGRFTALLRASAALLAGANHYSWPRFLLANGFGGVAWAILYGSAAAEFGRSIHRFTHGAAVGLVAVVILAVICAAVALRRNEARLLALAERAYPGPLTTAA